MPLIMEGTRPLTGPALPNLINAVKMLKSKPQNGAARCCRGDRLWSPENAEIVERGGRPGTVAPYGMVLTLTLTF